VPQFHEIDNQKCCTSVISLTSKQSRESVQLRCWGFNSQPRNVR